MFSAIKLALLKMLKKVFKKIKEYKRPYGSCVLKIV